MRIYIVSDLEGVAGVHGWDTSDDQSLTVHERRCRERRWLAEEVSAAADGFFRGGADAVTVNDGHGGGYAIDLDHLDPRVEVEHGSDHPFYCVGLDETCAGLASVGTHAKAGTPSATLCHTMSSAIRGYWLNGVSVGETGYQAFLAGHYGVPFIFCAGDAHACREMEELVPGCVTVAVKAGFSLHAARTWTPARAREMIREGAEEAVKRIGRIEPLKLKGPILFREEWHEPRFDAENPPEVGRVVDEHTLEIEAEDMVDLMYRKYGYDREWRPLGRER